MELTAVILKTALQSCKILVQAILDRCHRLLAPYKYFIPNISNITTDQKEAC